MRQYTSRRRLVVNLYEELERITTRFIKKIYEKRIWAKVCLSVWKFESFSWKMSYLRKKKKKLELQNTSANNLRYVLRLKNVRDFRQPNVIFSWKTQVIWQNEFRKADNGRFSRRPLTVFLGYSRRCQRLVQKKKNNNYYYYRRRAYAELVIIL